MSIHMVLEKVTQFCFPQVYREQQRMGVTTRPTDTNLSVDSKNARAVFSNQDAPVCGISARRWGLGQDLRAQGGK